jgi:hypothetical protein
MKPNHKFIDLTSPDSSDQNLSNSKHIHFNIEIPKSPFMKFSDEDKNSTTTPTILQSSSPSLNINWTPDSKENNDGYFNNSDFYIEDEAIEGLESII